MKRTLIAVSLALALATTLFAQQHRHGAMAGGPAGGPGMDQGRIFDLLQLTADQKAQWDALHQQLATTVQPLFDQRTAAQQQLQTLLGATSPDATAVGKQLLAIQAIGNQIKAAHDATEQQVENILSPDQKTKFEAWKATRPAMMGGDLSFCGGMGHGSCGNCPIH